MHEHLHANKNVRNKHGVTLLNALYALCVLIGALYGECELLRTRPTHDRCNDLRIVTMLTQTTINTHSAVRKPMRQVTRLTTTTKRSMYVQCDNHERQSDRWRYAFKKSEIDNGNVSLVSDVWRFQSPIIISLYIVYGWWYRKCASINDL